MTWLVCGVAVTKTVSCGLSGTHHSCVVNLEGNLLKCSAVWSLLLVLVVVLRKWSLSSHNISLYSSRNLQGSGCLIESSHIFCRMAWLKMCVLPMKYTFKHGRSIMQSPTVLRNHRQQSWLISGSHLCPIWYSYLVLFPTASKGTGKGLTDLSQPAQQFMPK